MLDEDERTRIQMSQNSQPSSSKLALLMEDNVGRRLKADVLSTG